MLLSLTRVSIAILHIVLLLYLYCCCCSCSWCILRTYILLLFVGKSHFWFSSSTTRRRSLLQPASRPPPCSRRQQVASVTTLLFVPPPGAQVLSRIHKKVQHSTPMTMATTSRTNHDYIFLRSSLPTDVRGCAGTSA